MRVDKTTMKAQIQQIGAFVRYVAQRFQRDGCAQSAAALTYMSLFAIVPMLTLMYGVFSLIPAFQHVGSQVEIWLFSQLLPSSGQAIAAYLADFSVQARKLSAVGGLILVVTAYLMLVNIEKTFNHIWDTGGGRRGLSGFLLYWAVLSLGPLLLAAGMVMRTYLLSFQLIVDEVDTLGVTQYVFAYLPWLLSWAAFSLLYIAVPNCRVHMGYAICGALVTTVLFESAKALFGVLVTHSSYNIVYGAFAVIPLFLIWLYLLWILILIGAEAVRSLETFALQQRGEQVPDLEAGLMVLWHCWQNQLRGDSLSESTIIGTGIDGQQWKRVRTLLMRERVLGETAENHTVLIRDLGTCSINDLFNWLGENPLMCWDNEFAYTDNIRSVNPWLKQYHALANNIRDAQYKNFAISIEALFAAAQPENNK